MLAVKRKLKQFKIERMRNFGAQVRLEGEDFDFAKLAARKFAQESGASLVEDSLDVETCEGAGTIAIELLKWKEPIDIVLSCFRQWCFTYRCCEMDKGIFP